VGDLHESDTEGEVSDKPDEVQYAIVRLAILVPEGIETEAQFCAYLEERFAVAGIKCCRASDLPEDGERWH
jgi:hypothetical protein